jgi:hypothetical protein
MQRILCSQECVDRDQSGGQPTVTVLRPVHTVLAIAVLQIDVHY